jgi:hypothetical protein
MTTQLVREYEERGHGALPSGIPEDEEIDALLRAQAAATRTSCAAHLA